MEHFQCQSTHHSELNMNGHCFICLRGEINAAMVTSTAIKTFGAIVCYLTGCHPHSSCQCEQEFLHNNIYKDRKNEVALQNNTTFEEHKVFWNVLKSIGNEPPLLCVDCYDRFAEINRLHHEQQEIQRKINTEVTIIRELVLKTRNGRGDGKRRQNVFLESFRKSNIPADQIAAVTSLVFKVHERIIGSKSGQFPAPKDTTRNQNVFEDPVQTSTLGDHVRRSFLEENCSVIHETSEPEPQSKVQNTSSTCFRDKSINESRCRPEIKMELDDDYRPLDATGTRPSTESIVAPTSPVLSNSPLINTPAAAEGMETQSTLNTTSSMNVCGVPVDPTASYVMITTNVTDPLTGTVTVQPMLINVATLQAQAQSQIQTPTSVVTSTTGPTILSMSETPSTTPSPHTVPLPNESQRNMVNQKSDIEIIAENPKKCKVQPQSAKSSNYEVDLSTANNYYQTELRIQLCDICGQRIPQGQHGSSHVVIHVGSDYTYHCKHCDHNFATSFRMYEYHRERHLPCTPNPVTIIHCDLCAFRADSIPVMRKHMETHSKDHSLPTSYPCPLCHFIFKSKKMVELHLYDKHLLFLYHKGRQACDICKGKTKTMFSFNDIESHLLEAHGIKKPLRCKMCPYMCSTLESMIVHQGRAKVGGAKCHERVCHLCENVNKFLNNNALKEHYFEVHGLGSKFICEVCNDEFPTREKLDVHLDKFHNISTPGPSSSISSIESRGTNPTTTTANSTKTKKKQKQPIRKAITCLECNFKFFKCEMIQHKIEKHGHPPLKCTEPICESTFTSPKELRLHVSGVHRGFTVSTRQKPSLTCADCGLQFSDRIKLKSHMKVHSTNRPYKCPHDSCGNSYKARNALNLHIKYAHLKMPKEKKYFCDHCSKGFFTSAMLQSHIMVHTGERPFACQHCGQRFRQKMALITHEAGHTLLGGDFKPKGEMERRIRVSTQETSS